MATIAAVIASTHHPFYYRASTATGADRPPFADEELRHVVEPDLVEVVAAYEHEHVGVGPGECLAERGDLGDPLVGERRPVLACRRGRAVVERVVGRGDDRCDSRHGGSLAVNP